MCFADPMHPTDEVLDMYFAPLIASPRRKALVHVYAMALEANPLDGIARQLARSRIPVRIVWAMGDTIFSPASPAYLDKAFGNSRGVRRLERGKLFWPEEQPDVVAEEAKRLWGV
jgi:pimeloyl-ACP methyl ester carboxylesterase